MIRILFFSLIVLSACRYTEYEVEEVKHDCISENIDTLYIKEGQGCNFNTVYTFLNDNTILVVKGHFRSVFDNVCIKGTKKTDRGTGINASILQYAAKQKDDQKIIHIPFCTDLIFTGDNVVYPEEYALEQFDYTVCFHNNCELSIALTDIKKPEGVAFQIKEVLIKKANVCDVPG